jgi:hypothetical protein
MAGIESPLLLFPRGTSFGRLSLPLLLLMDNTVDIITDYNDIEARTI